MQDMIDALGALRGTGAQTPAGEDAVAADLARGHRALVRRRRRIVGVGVAAVGAATAVAVAVVGPVGESGSSVGTKRVAQPSASSGHSGTSIALELAAYKGVQPAGFEVDTVPAGWSVSSSDEYSFVAVPPGTGSHHSGANFMDGIAVFLQGDSVLPDDSPVTKVTVHGKVGQLGFSDGREAKWLIFPDAAGDKVLVQVPTKLGLTDDQIIRFAQGITVTSHARAARG
ncbi:hypothetical protein [Streptomyces sp. MK5]|uniref:hypothetical protein n=1 Tax=Streptomyces sp. MK5 TaxID=3064253 RepID=UPI0027425DA4|nr:hypothetical protein [Streptomyces sp. MK5]